MKINLSDEESYKLLGQISDDILDKMSELLNANAAAHANDGLSKGLIEGAQYASMLVILKIYEEVMTPGMLEAAKRAGTVLYDMIVDRTGGPRPAAKPFDPNRAN